MIALYLGDRAVAGTQSILKYLSSTIYTKLDELTLIDILEVRFENVPSDLVDAINQIEDPSLLKTLLRQAITIGSISEFQCHFNQLIERENT